MSLKEMKRYEIVEVFDVKGVNFVKQSTMSFETRHGNDSQQDFSHPG